jgi:hypothetical protein
MKKCNKCGKGLPENAKFCPSCGSSDIFDSARQVSEYKRTCKQCSFVWHILAEREEQIKKGIEANKKDECCNMCDENAKRQRIERFSSFQNEFKRLKICPKCGSGDYQEETLVYEKK